MPKKPNLNTQANIAMSITFLMPNFFMKNGIRRMHSVSDIWLREIRALALRAPHASAYSGFPANEEMNELA